MSCNLNKKKEIRNDNDNIIRIGIMGGTFDPIHFGHLVTAETARFKFNLNKVIFIPTGNPPHKINKYVTESNHRYMMTVLATATNPSFEVSRIEIDRKGYTYTIDTIKELNDTYNKKVKFFFITGADVVEEILNWKNPRQLLEICEFIAATRPGYNENTLIKNIENITMNYDGKINFFEVPSLAISSTDIRNRVLNDISIKYLLPESVEMYIYKNSIYKKEKKI